MPPFYNRHPWNLLLGLGIITALFVVLAAATSWWLLLTPVVLIAGSYVRTQAIRAYALMTVGHHSRSIRHGRLIYEERHARRIRSLILELENTEPGHYELFVPPDLVWAQSVPHWATARRIEIAERIAASWRRDDVHIVDKAIGA